jgi:hypothetical protein
MAMDICRIGGGGEIEDLKETCDYLTKLSAKY